MSIEHLHPVPHLTTALSGPLGQIESHLLACQTDIEAWQASKRFNEPACAQRAPDSGHRTGRRLERSGKLAVREDRVSTHPPGSTNTENRNGRHCSTGRPTGAVG